ncbi:MAG: pyrroline-5-carboxylate reductase [Anaerolineae bacterium]|nr:pyrroline-5-carboxylate reductase [Anaerolineae bacterium]
MDLSSKIIAFIGSGAMAEAMISSLVGKKLADPGKLLAADVRRERVDELAREYGIRPYTDNADAASQADAVVLSIKPQRLDKILDELKGGIRPDALVLSIVAGAPMQKISEGLEHAQVVRSMPNTPAQIGEGITVWIPSPAISEEQKEIAATILGAMGEEILVDSEIYLDMATALSGTGPAYVFLFMEAMIDAGVHMGFSRPIAEQLVLQTIKGSVSYYQKINRDDEVHVAALRNQVTSSGGTTAEALYYLEKAGFRTSISRAIWAAYQRSLELGKGKPVHIPDTRTDNGG